MYGLIHIRFNENCNESEMMTLISKFYKDNEDKIEGMKFYEYTGTDQDYKSNDQAFYDIIEKRPVVRVQGGNTSLADFAGIP